MRCFLLALLIFSASFAGADSFFKKDGFSFETRLGLGGGLLFLDDSRFASTVAPNILGELGVRGGFDGFRMELFGGFASQADSRVGVVVYRGFWGPYGGLSMGWAFPFNDEVVIGAEGLWKVNYGRYHYLAYDFLIMSIGVAGTVDWKPFKDNGLVFSGKVRWEHRLDPQLVLNSGPQVLIFAGWSFL